MVKFAWGRCKLFLCLVSKLWFLLFVRERFSFWTTNINKDNMYCDVKGKMCNFLNKHTLCPYHFNMLLSNLSKIINVILIFSVMNSFLLVVWKSLQLFNKYPFLYLSVSSLTCNPVSKFPNCNLKCFLALYKIFVSLYSPKYIYSRVGYLVLFSPSRIVQFF